MHYLKVKTIALLLATTVLCATSVFAEITGEPANHGDSKKIKSLSELDQDIERQAKLNKLAELRNNAYMFKLPIIAPALNMPVSPTPQARFTPKPASEPVTLTVDSIYLGKDNKLHASLRMDKDTTLSVLQGDKINNDIKVTHISSQGVKVTVKGRGARKVPFTAMKETQSSKITDLPAI